MVRAVGKKIFDLLSISLLHSPSLSLLPLSLSLPRALPLSMGGELGSPRANVGMGIRSSCVGWVHPGSALTWVGGELGSQDQRHEPRGEIKYVKRYDPVELKVCVVDVPNALWQVMSIWIWFSISNLDLFQELVLDLVLDLVIRFLSR